MSFGVVPSLGVAVSEGDSVGVSEGEGLGCGVESGCLTPGMVVCVSSSLPPVYDDTALPVVSSTAVMTTMTPTNRMIAPTVIRFQGRPRRAAGAGSGGPGGPGRGRPDLPSSRPSRARGLPLIPRLYAWVATLATTLPIAAPTIVPATPNVDRSNAADIAAPAAAATCPQFSLLSSSSTTRVWQGRRPQDMGMRPNTRLGRAMTNPSAQRSHHGVRADRSGPQPLGRSSGDGSSNVCSLPVRPSFGGGGGGGRAALTVRICPDGARNCRGGGQSSAHWRASS